MRLGPFTVSACVCLTVITASAQPPLAEHLPAESLAYAGWAGRNLIFDGSVTGQLINEPAMGEMLAAVKALGQKDLQGGQADRFSHAWAMASVAWEHPIAAALIDLAIVDGRPEPVAWLLIELGKDREAFAEHLDAIVASLRQDEVSVTEETIGQTVYRVAQADRGRPEIAFGFKGSLFFLTVGPETPRKLIELTAERALPANRKFAECWQAVGGEDDQLAFYVDVEALLDRIEQLTSPQQPSQAPETQSTSGFRKIINALGVGKVTAVANCTRILDRGMYSKTRLFTPGPHEGLLMPLAGAPLTDADLGRAPQDTDFLGAFRLSAEALWAEIKKAAGLIDPKLADGLIGTAGDLEEKIGISIDDDILAALGDTVLVASAPSQGGMLTGSVISVSLRDPEKLRAAMGKIQAYVDANLLGAPAAWTCPKHPQISQAGPGRCLICGTELAESAEKRPARARFRTAKAGRTRIHYLSGTAEVPMPVAPAWAIHEDRLYIAGWPQVIAATIEARETSEGSIAAQANFRKARAHVSDRASIILYVNSPKILRQTYNYLLAAWTMASGLLGRHAGLETRPDWLPPLPTLEKYIWPSIDAVSADREGITFENYGSLPISGACLWPVGTPLSPRIILPSLNSARANARRVASMVHLKRIYDGMMLYAEDHSGRVPPDLATLMGNYCPSADIFVSPNSQRTPPRLVDGKFDGEIDYVYVASGNMWQYDVPDKVVVLYERPANYAGKETVVLFADGHVEEMKTPELRKALERSPKAMKAQPEASAKPSSDF